MCFWWLKVNEARKFQSFCFLFWLKLCLFLCGRISAIIFNAFDWSSCCVAFPMVADRHDVFGCEPPSFHAALLCSCSMDTGDKLPSHRTQRFHADVRLTSNDNVFHSDDTHIDGRLLLHRLPSSFHCHSLLHSISWRLLSLVQCLQYLRSCTNRWSVFERLQVAQCHRSHIPSHPSFHSESHCSDCLCLLPTLHTQSLVDWCWEQLVWHMTVECCS